MVGAGEGLFVLDGGLFTECGVESRSVVERFDPHGDDVGSFASGGD